MNMHYIVSHINKLAATKPTLLKNKTLKNNLAKKDFLQEQGYKKSGKIYTPPILQLGQFNGVNWIDELIPEFFWIGLLQQEFGFANGSNLVSKVVEIALNISKDKNIWYAPVNSFRILTELDKLLLKYELQKIDILSDLQIVFSDITFYYPEFPLSFLIESRDEIPDKPTLEIFKIFLDSIFDRTSITATKFHKPKNDQEWQNYFWNRGLIIDKCK